MEQVDTTITAAVDPATLALIDRVAAAHGRSRDEFVAEAVQRVAETEADLLAFVQEGIDAADRGELIGSDEMDRWFDEQIAFHRTRCDG